MSSRQCYTSYSTSSGASVTTIDPKFAPGDYVHLHCNSQSHRLLPCRIIEVVGEKYRVCCGKGVLKMLYREDNLTPLATSKSISLYKWPLLPKLSATEAIHGEEQLETCTCKVSETDITTIDDSQGHSIEGPQIEWIRHPRFTLYNLQKQIISTDRWLDDKLIDAAQSLIAEQFPNVSGLQPVPLQRTQSFAIKRHAFVQVLSVGGSHWITASNVGCKEGEVNVYDSMLGRGATTSVKSSIARIMFCPSSPLCLNYMDVTQQRNGYDCGIFSIAYAYDICRGKDPCQVDYNHKSIRRHLATCFEKKNITKFPSVGDRSIVNRIRYSELIDLYCVCRMPEKCEGEEDMVECELCRIWFHQKCLDIPDHIFDDKDNSWTCTHCQHTN